CCCCEGGGGGGRAREALRRSGVKRALPLASTTRVVCPHPRRALGARNIAVGVSSRGEMRAAEQQAPSERRADELPEKDGWLLATPSTPSVRCLALPSAAAVVHCSSLPLLRRIELELRSPLQDWPRSLHALRHITCVRVSGAFPSGFVSALATIPLLVHLD